MNRRQFFRLSGLGVLTGLYTWQIEPYWLEFVQKRMPINNLPKDLNGLTLMQISDIHIGKWFDWSYILKSFQKAQKLNPDFVVYTGDYVSYKDHQQVDQLATVFQNAVKGRLGTIGILGNHDYGLNWSQEHVAKSIITVLESAGVSMLRNEQKTINGLNFIGIDDYWSTNFYPEKVLSAFDSKKANITLCHNPDVCDLDIWNGYDSWILSGHTHGGQCKPPFLPPPMLPVKNRKYTAGEISLSGGRTLYINRALGHLFPVRFNVRPEITVFKLVQA